MSVVLIPKLDSSESVYKDYPVVGKPGWFRVTDTNGNPLKPIIRCNCGSVSGIGLHHVHADGTVTASFYHKKGNVYPEDPDGCEWHVFLKLEGWMDGDIPPDPK